MVHALLLVCLASAAAACAGATSNPPTGSGAVTGSGTGTGTSSGSGSGTTGSGATGSGTTGPGTKVDVIGAVDGTALWSTQYAPQLHDFIVNAGTQVVFTADSLPHTVTLMASESSYEACDFTLSTKLTDFSTSRTFTLDTTNRGGSILLIADQDNCLQSSMRFRLTVIGTANQGSGASGATPSSTVDVIGAKNGNALWTVQYADQLHDFSVNEGTGVTFTADNSPHTVTLMASEASFEACDFILSTPLTDFSASKTFTLPTSGYGGSILLIADQYNCIQSNMKFRLAVIGSASTSQGQSGSPTTGVTAAPSSTGVGGGGGASSPSSPPTSTGTNAGAPTGTGGGSTSIPTFFPTTLTTPSPTTLVTTPPPTPLATSSPTLATTSAPSAATVPPTSPPSAPTNARGHGGGKGGGGGGGGGGKRVLRG